MFRGQTGKLRPYDIELRKLTTTAAEHLNAGRMFMADECIAAIWNIFFAKHGGFHSDIDVLDAISEMSLLSANKKNSLIIDRELEILHANKSGIEEGGGYERPTVDVLLPEDKRSEIRRHGNLDDPYLKYLINFETKFNMSRDLFYDIAPEPGSVILDVGTGAGFLPYILKYNGFDEVEAFDMPEYSDSFKASCRILGVEKKEFRIEKHEPMMSFGKKFDIIICGALQFDGHSNDPSIGEESEWGMAEWLFFLEDIRDNQLTDDGFIWLEFTIGWLGTTQIEANKEQAEAIGAMFRPYLITKKNEEGDPVKLSRRDISRLLVDAAAP